MNGRTKSEGTPWGRLAAAAVTLVTDVQQRFKKRPDYARLPDYADFNEAFRAPMLRELLKARIDEVERSPAGLRRDLRLTQLRTEFERWADE